MAGDKCDDDAWSGAEAWAALSRAAVVSLKRVFSDRVPAETPE
jgi:hypothetical protein